MRLYRRFVVAMVALLLVGSALLSIHSIGNTVPVVADLGTLPTIILDAGHGGVDGGAVGVNGEVEKDINLSIALILRDMFRMSGYEVVMTRETDISIHDEGIKSVRKMKTSDLHNRLALVEAHPNAVFVSIHQNKFGSSSSWGTQVFFSPNNPLSEELAASIQSNVTALLQPGNNREYKKAGKNLYLMYQAKCPSVLVECGFLSNAEEAVKLSQTQYQSQMAFSIYYSVMDYLQPKPDIPGAMTPEGET